MRILHFADIHIGVENYGRTDPETGLSTRLSDFLAAYDEVVEYALGHDVDLVLFCGDAYKSRDPSQTHQREFAKRVARLAGAGLPVFLLVGNHDMPHVLGRATALEIFQTLDVSNVHIGDTLRTHRIETKAGPVQIVAVPWVRRSVFLSQDDSRGLSPDQVNEAIQERLARAIQQQAEDLDASVPAIFSGHLTVSDATTGSERTMMLGRDYVLVRSSVALPQFDYVALGHIHKHQILGNNPLVVYAGSLQRVDFGEEKDPKGFCIVDIDPTAEAGARVTQHSFETVNARTFRTVSVDIRTGDLQRELFTEGRRKEWKSLNVIPVAMGQKQNGVVGAIAVDHVQAEFSNAASGIKNESSVIGKANLDARCITPIPNRFRPG